MEGDAGPVAVTARAHANHHLQLVLRVRTEKDQAQNNTVSGERAVRADGGMMASEAQHRLAESAATAGGQRGQQGGSGPGLDDSRS